jgi:hypothetical protein
VVNGWAAKRLPRRTDTARGSGVTAFAQSGEPALFLFFSNRTGCGTSLLITALGSLILLWLTGWLG